MRTTKKTPAPPVARSAEPLYREIRSVLESARAGAYRAVNAAMVQAYWQVGRLIVEHEQKGRRRAGYGEAVIATLAERLTQDLGRGFNERNLWYMRSFHLAFPILNAVRSELPESGKPNATRSELAIHRPTRDEAPAPAQGFPATLRPELSWTHYRLLLGVEDPQAREWYMNEAAEQHWSTRQLERQISVLYYERLLVSRRKAPVRREAATRLATVEPEQFIRDPYILEFLDLKEYPALRESAVEQVIIDNLQAFLLELGKGFSFVARQKRMRFEDEDFYVDLVFYNYLLKCFVLIDLKVGKLAHQDIGQMDSYVRMFDAHARPEGDNPTIGLILCSKKNEAIAKYSVLSEARQIFAAKYVKVLPTERELMREIQRERRLVDARHADEETLTSDRYGEEDGAAVKKAGKKGTGAKAKARK
ncbi:MAG TPA: PDDEXK nuclease domain-containing protein [Thermoanaerobaculia bacterium]|jgi:predicted nuclease of restriction endonuclease-like (RecB) superfamily|nr:PDDEXK nuclease domain-containing protein [Thermoanaerobaculia bacterium]